MMAQPTMIVVPSMPQAMPRKLAVGAKLPAMPRTAPTISPIAAIISFFICFSVRIDGKMLLSFITNQRLNRNCKDLFWGETCHF